MESKKASNRIIDVVRLRRTMKNWKKIAAKSGGNAAVPRGHVALFVGEEPRRFVVPTEYLGHVAFGELLREAEEEFGFEQEGVLRIPCHVAAFERAAEAAAAAAERSSRRRGLRCCAAEAELSLLSHSQEPICR